MRKVYDIKSAGKISNFIYTMLERKSDIVIPTKNISTKNITPKDEDIVRT